MTDPKIAKALRFAHVDVSRTWTVAELAGKAGMSRSAFAMRFNEVVGLSPIAYLFGWRMTLARQALATRDRPKADISGLAGYQSVSAFSAAFRRLTGSSPTEDLSRLP